jgi:hypothetical protein
MKRKIQMLQLPFLKEKVEVWTYDDYTSLAPHPKCFICGNNKTFCISYPNTELQNLIEELNYTIFRSHWAATSYGLPKKTKKKFVCSGTCLNEVIKDNWNFFIYANLKKGLADIFG